MKYLIYCSFIFALMQLLILINTQQICNTETNRLGKCVPANHCKYREFSKLKNDSYCNSTEVCCELRQDDSFNECITPNNDTGACVKMEECPMLRNLLNTKPFSKIGVKYLTMSGCKDLGTFLVCCSGKAPNYTVVFEEHAKEYYNDADVNFLLPLPEQCAFDNNNEIDGNLIFGINQYPWMAQIEYKNVKNPIKYSCSAILISKRYLIAAAHCVDEDAYVHVGEPINIRIGEPGNIYITIPIEEIILHPRYFSLDFLENMVLKKNDISLIRMKDATPFTDFIKPICLPNSYMAEKASNLKVLVRLSNDTYAKKYIIDANIENLYSCQKSVQEMNPNIMLWYKQICAKFTMEAKSFDFQSENLLLSENDDKYYLMGINNQQKDSCKKKCPSVFTKIDPYVKWIRNTIKP